MDVIQRVRRGNPNNDGNSKTQGEMPKIKHCQMKNASMGLLKDQTWGQGDASSGGGLLAVHAQGLYVDPQSPHQN